MSNLYRSSDEKVIAGVCAGLAHKLDLNMTGLRWVVAVVTLFLSGIPAIVYIILWAILKPRPTGGDRRLVQMRTTPQNIERFAEQSISLYLRYANYFMNVPESCLSEKS